MIHFKNFKIATQLRLALGSLLVLFALLCLLSWRQSDTLWRQTAMIYNHPLAVRTAATAIKTAVLDNQLTLRDLILSGDASSHLGQLHDIAGRMAQAQQQFGVIEDRYLGPRSDIETARQGLAHWKTALDATLHALAVGAQAAPSRPPLTRRADAAAQELRAAIETISVFASDKAEQLHAEAEADQDGIFPRLSAFLGVLMLLCGGIMFHLLESLRTPLRALTRTAERFQRGDYSQRVAVESQNEFGVLGAAFNNLAETVHTELTLKEELVQLAEVMLRKGDLHVFCRHVLGALLHHTASQSGAVYLLDEDSQEFRHYESIGLSMTKDSFSAANLEGEFGPAIALGQIRRISDIPPDTRFALASVGGSFVPREIVTIPVQSGQNVVAVISLASLTPYPALSLRLLEEIRDVLSARLDALLLNRKLRDFMAQLEQQNVELEIQKKELAVQAAQLLEQNAELELQKQRMDETNRLKSAFLSNMSHELRTPLNSVIALSEVLTRRLRPTIPAEEQNYLEMIERNGRQLLELINSILDLSRIEAGREDVHIAPFKVRDLTEAVLDTLAPQAQAKEVELRHHVPTDLPLLRSDFVKCRHILQNLVGNAVKFTHAGHVEITAACTGPDLRITVSDTGIGIESDHLPYIFDEFRQGDESTSRNFGGTGLGLSIARKYATMLHGDIEVQSVPDQGATFTLRLPLTQPDASGPAARTRPAVPASVLARSGQGKRLLLVEDSEPAVIQVRDILTTQGYDVAVARNGRQALDQIAREVPDAMILDLMMPEVDGFEVLRAVRAVEATAQLPVLILTAKHITREELSFLKGNHVHQLIQKGDVNKADLLAAIAAMVFPEPEPKPEPAPPAPRTTVRTTRPIILVVEDNPDNMVTMRALLRDKAVLVEAANGQDGLRAARAHRPEVILMDISLPIMDGFAALAALRADEELRHIPVIAVTASAMAGDREAILKHGFDDYLSKPLDGDALEQMIERVLQGANPANAPEPQR